MFSVKKPSDEEGDFIKVGLVNLVWFLLRLAVRRSSSDLGKSWLVFRLSLKRGFGVNTST